MFTDIYYSFIILLVSAHCDASKNHEALKLPDDFLIGTSTAAYQIEGAWNTNGRGPSIWDEFTHRYPHKITDESNGDMAANSYELFDEDIKLLKNVGMKFYRFSISWSRIFPNGDRTSLNKNGVLYYDRLIDRLIDNGIEPMVTMYHWDMPQALVQFGGFTNALIIEYFEAYADFLFRNYGNKVKYWFTFNEPSGFCLNGYGNSTQPPLIQANGIGEYLCVNNVLKAHGKAYRLYRRKYYEKQNGKIGITFNGIFAYPLDYGTSAIELERADRAIQFMYGWLAHPIYKGDYPPIMRKRIDSNSQREGRWRSRLPKLTRKWIKGINGTADFFSFNYYSSRLVTEMPHETKRNEDANNREPSWANDMHLNFSVDATWKQSHADWLYAVPNGLGDLLRWIKKEYNNPPVLISENGWCDDGRLDDIDRVEYLRSHLIEVVKAIQNDGCNVKAYTIWSIIDNFEWLSGYTHKFGIHHVNFTSAGRERTPKLSAEFIKYVNLHRTIPLV